MDQQDPRANGGNIRRPAGGNIRRPAYGLRIKRGSQGGKVIVKASLGATKKGEKAKSYCEDLIHSNLF